MSTKAKQEESKKQEAVAVNKTLLTIDYTSVYSFNKLHIPLLNFNFREHLNYRLS